MVPKFIDFDEKNSQKYAKKLLTTHIIMCYIIWVLGELAQLARASALHAEGQGFESPILHQLDY